MLFFNDYENNAQLIEEIFLSHEDPSHLAFRDIPQLINDYCKQPPALLKGLDYGCGSGNSTVFLKSQGFKNTLGIDISQAMLLRARKRDPAGIYLRTSGNKTAFPSESFNFVLSSFVLVEQSTEQAVQSFMDEIYRLLKPGGACILITPSTHLFNNRNDWVDYSIKGFTNKLKNGNQVSYIYKGTILFQDYYWSEGYTQKAGLKAGFTFTDIHQPLAFQEDLVTWKSEYTTPLYNNYVFVK